MKTRKQVLAEFQRMQNQLFDGKMDGIVHVDTYNDGENWTVSITRSTFNKLSHKVVDWDKCEWEHYDRFYSEDDEKRNESALAAFKKKFNIK